MTLPVSFYILMAAALHLGAFISYPHSGRFGFTFLYVSMILWTGGAIFINRAANYHGGAWKAAVAAGFALLCAFSAFAFLPQKDGKSPLLKLTSGQYPEKRDLYFGLLRLGVDAPGLLPPQKEEPLP
ncbi:MAG: hypothetical protein PHV36_13865 [Elusimicrobiales bacterium]|nr:hypothetical protein [Elusimicrobiales bacterium]